MKKCGSLAFKGRGSILGSAKMVPKRRGRRRGAGLKRRRPGFDVYG